ncbi:MAG TPA: YeiH family protein [Steroidobacteraceae bacterium]
MMDSIKSRSAGVALTGALALASIVLARIPLIERNGLSALTLAIILGMLVGNWVIGAGESRFTAGIAFGKQTLLRLGVVLYGLRLTFQDIAHVGVAGLLIDTIMLSCTFLLAWWAGTRWFQLDRTTAMLIGAGSAICGAAAVMATDPVVRGRADQVAIAVSTVVVFGTSAIFLYPFLYHLNLEHHIVAMTPGTFGIFAGSTIHEVAQVVAAGRAVGDSAADTAVITKMVRVMMLAPFLLLLSAYLARSKPSEPEDAAVPARVKLTIPWFALWFVAVTALHSVVRLPAVWVSAAVNADTVILAMAMAALGLTTHRSAIGQAGLKPIALGALLFTWLIVGGAVVNTVLERALS